MPDLAAQAVARKAPLLQARLGLPLARDKTVPERLVALAVSEAGRRLGHE